MFAINLFIFNALSYECVINHVFDSQSHIIGYLMADSPNILRSEFNHTFDDPILLTDIVRSSVFYDEQKGVPWRILVRPTVCISGKFLEVGIQCCLNNSSQLKWSLSAYFKFNITADDDRPLATYFNSDTFTVNHQLHFAIMLIRWREIQLSNILTSIVKKLHVRCSLCVTDAQGIPQSESVSLKRSFPIESLVASVSHKVSRYEDTINKLIECAVCLQQFTDPRRLECEHSYCFKCIQRMLQDGHTLSCPQCRAITFVPFSFSQNISGYFKKNFTLIQLIDASQTKTLDENCCNRCKSAISSQNLLMCKHCCLEFCDICLNFHQKAFADEVSNNLLVIDREIADLKKDFVKVSGHGADEAIREINGLQSQISKSVEEIISKLREKEKSFIERCSKERCSILNDHQQRIQEACFQIKIFESTVSDLSKQHSSDSSMTSLKEISNSAITNLKKIRSERQSLMKPLSVNSALLLNNFSPDDVMRTIDSMNSTSIPSPSPLLSSASLSRSPSLDDHLENHVESVPSPTTISSDSDVENSITSIFESVAHLNRRRITLERAILGLSNVPQIRIEDS